MSRYSKFILLTAIVTSGGAMLISLNRPDATEDASDAGSVSSLIEWAELTQRPGFVLLDSADLHDYYVCVYDTGASEIALCYRWKHAESGPDTRSFIVRDSDGQNLQDASRWNTATDLNPVGSIPAHLYVDGMVVPIKDEHRGAIQVELMDNADSELATRSVYAKTLHIGADAAEAEQE